MATTYVKNQKQLADAILEKYVASAMKMTQQTIYDAIQESINTFYSEYDPKVYERQFIFLQSLIKTDINRIGNTISCEVKIDEDYLKYQYPDNGGLNATGLDVVKWANRDINGYGNHGGTVDVGRDNGFWDDAVDGTLGGETGIIAILKASLKKRGLNIK